MQKLLTIEEISKELGVGKATVYKLVKEKIKHTKIGRRILVDEKDLSDYINESKNLKNI